MSNSLKVSLYSPERPLADITATEILIPGIYGYMGILPGHTALISQLGSGKLEIKSTDATDSKFFISGGYMEVVDDCVRILVDVIEREDEIDLDRVLESEKRAINRLQGSTDMEVDIARALASLERAKARKTLKDRKLK